MKENYGVLTMATRDDYLKVIGMSLSFRISNKNIPISIVCSEELKDELSAYFDTVIIERDDLKGFQHKIYLDEYSPYDATLFLDADMLVFRSVVDECEKWRGFPYIAQGRYNTEGTSTFGLDIGSVCTITGSERMSNISGAGHAYFRKPDCNKLFKKAREIMNDYDSYGENLRFADEDVMNIAMTTYGYPVYDGRDFMGMPIHAKNNTLNIDVMAQKCRFKSKKFGWVEPCVMHFAYMQAPLLYLRELTKLYKQAGIYNKYRMRLYRMTLTDAWVKEIEWKTRKKIKKLLRYNKIQS